MTDVLQVLEFPKAKLYLLKQLRITKIIHITALKFTLSRGHLFGGGRSMGGGTYFTAQGFREGSSEGIYLKYSNRRSKS